MATIYHFENALNEQREKIKVALAELVTVYGEDHYDALNNVYQHILPLRYYYNLPIDKSRIICHGSEIIFQGNGEDLPFEFVNIDKLARLYDRLASQINDAILEINTILSK